MSQPIKIMTCNLRIRNDKDGNNSFDNRVGKLTDMLRRENADVIGFQEADDYMLEKLREALPEHTFLGHGRSKQYNGEGTPIAFRTGRFYVHSFAMEWLSNTPDVPGSRLAGVGQSNCPRTLAHATLVDRENESVFSFYNIHTDHKSETARVAECMVLSRYLYAEKFPFAVTGDFNALPDSPPIDLIRATEELGTVEATAHIGGSFHAFRMDRIRNGEMIKIDYIFTNLKTDPAASYAVEDDNACGHFYSDHFSLISFVNFKETEKE